jgi:hypothetical protein
LLLHNFISCCPIFRIHSPHSNKVFKFCALDLSHIFTCFIFPFVFSLRLSSTQC